MDAMPEGGSPASAAADPAKLRPALRGDRVCGVEALSLQPAVDGDPSLPGEGAGVGGSGRGVLSLLEDEVHARPVDPHLSCAVDENAVQQAGSDLDLTIPDLRGRGTPQRGSRPGAFINGADRHPRGAEGEDEEEERRQEDRGGHGVRFPSGEQARWG
jgi:hypothetical protein